MVKACALCKEQHNGACECAYNSMVDAGFEVAGNNILVVSGRKFLQVKMWSTNTRNCDDFSFDEDKAKVYVDRGEDVYNDNLYDWYFDND